MPLCVFLSVSERKQKLAPDIGCIQHFPLRWHLSSQGTCLCVFTLEMENVVAVLIWSCSLARASAFATEWIRVLLHQKYGQAGWITCAPIGTHTSVWVCVTGSEDWRKHIHTCTHTQMPYFLAAWGCKDCYVGVGCAERWWEWMGMNREMRSHSHYRTT